ncbi:MAG: hypothetical protein NVSMB8_13110 [Candidatus Limnocylindrales bacterium]
MDIAAFASFGALIAAWLVLPLRVPAAIAAARDAVPNGTEAQSGAAVPAAA